MRCIRSLRKTAIIGLFALMCAVCILPTSAHAATSPFRLSLTDTGGFYTTPGTLQAILTPTRTIESGLARIAFSFPTSLNVTHVYAQGWSCSQHTGSPRVVECKNTVRLVAGVVTAPALEVSDATLTPFTATVTGSIRTTLTAPFTAVATASDTIQPS